jgi:predicted dehydrogenase
LKAEFHSAILNGMSGLKFGLIGIGFMGKAHAIALNAVGTVFSEIEPPVCELLADRSEQSARSAASAFGFLRATSDWRALISDPRVDVVDICTPNHLHYEMAAAAIAAGKHVYCEKPLALDSTEARALCEAAESAGVHNAIGFNYICNPLLAVAHDAIAAGEIGEVCGLRGWYVEDYMADPAVPYSWRCQRRLAGSGALADLGSHLVNLVHYLLGPIVSVCGSMRTVHAHRQDRATGELRNVENEDSAHALLELASGVTGTLDISRIATGHKCGLGIHVFGTRGALSFDQERMNELRLYSAEDPAGRRGFRTILTAPEHPDYAAFCPAPGHGLGINDLKIIELRNLIRGIATSEPAQPDFREGLRVQQVMEAIERSHSQHGWVEV